LNFLPFFLLLTQIEWLSFLRAERLGMTQMVYEVYDALKSINVSDEKATEVAKALGNQDEKLNEVKFELKEEIREFRSEFLARILKLESDINARISKLESDLSAKIRLNAWMLGIVIVMQSIVLGVVFRFLSP
jgi:hypothetical protein